ncbi:Mrl1p [Saccharomyces cerevisiae x Saccharomyces kudriavzevii VIN7]|uniref:Mrl1p n=1 Tax=Saccharomyces cerevisiae x Saccharomyces kudriavzevii (strain VIN7) TaxID=1095631 RepID=H0H2F0_SACCK|nr:Mrl1p [Saccharomyces cerevisiae x Saccharomyces kudriavzevii VIN7]
MLVGGPTAKKLTLKYENGSICPNGKDKKATLLNFVCDKEIQSKAQISYIGNLHDCSYFFEVRSIYACPTSNKRPRSAFWVFSSASSSSSSWLSLQVEDGSTLN